MLFKSLSEYQNVIHITNHYPSVDKVLQYVIHHSLKSGRGVAESKEHNQWLIQASIGTESCLPFMSFLYSDIIEPPLEIQDRKVLGSLKVI